MRRSTELSFQHRRPTVAKLYTAFVRAMTRAASEYGGEVRGIIGDRVMVIFEQSNCFAMAYDTAILINSVCKYIINPRFLHNEVEFGIGIDYGRMMATKTGIRRHGAAQQSYRSLVWLGRPANVASKLTDNANKSKETCNPVVVKARYDYGAGPVWRTEWPHEFVQSFTYNPLNGAHWHQNPAFRELRYETQTFTTRPATPPILMTEAVYNGLKRARPNDSSITNGWLKTIDLKISGYTGTIYGADVIFPAVKRS
jgi:adenylate cyclase